jgi:hypothetical protein
VTGDDKITTVSFDTSHGIIFLTAQGGFPRIFAVRLATLRIILAHLTGGWQW